MTSQPSKRLQPLLVLLAVATAACTTPLVPVAGQAGKSSVATYYAGLARPVKAHLDQVVNDPELQLKITNLTIGRAVGGARLGTKSIDAPEAGERDFELTDDIQVGDRPPHALTAQEAFFDPADSHEDTMTVTDKTVGVQRTFYLSHDATTLTISEGSANAKGLPPYSIRFERDGNFQVSDGALSTLMTKLFHVAGPSSLAHYRAVQAAQKEQLVSSFAASPLGQATPPETLGEVYEGEEGMLVQPEEADGAFSSQASTTGTNKGPGSGSAADDFLRLIYLARKNAK